MQLGLVSSVAVTNNYGYISSGTGGFYGIGCFSTTLAMAKRLFTTRSSARTPRWIASSYATHTFGDTLLRGTIDATDYFNWLGGFSEVQNDQYVTGRLRATVFNGDFFYETAPTGDDYFDGSMAVSACGQRRNALRTLDYPGPTIFGGGRGGFSCRGA